MPGIVFHVYFISLLFWEWGSLSHTLSLSVSSILWCSVSLPPLPPPHIMRFPGEWSPNLIALYEWCTLGYMFVFFSPPIVIVIGFYCVAHVNFLPYFSFWFTPSLRFCIWTGSVSFLLTCIPSLTYLSHLCLVICSMWECCDCFDWYLCCIWRLLIGWIFYFSFLFGTHSWSCEAPIFGCV